MFCMMLKMSQIKTSKWLFREIAKTSKWLFAPKNALFYPISKRKSNIKRKI